MRPLVFTMLVFLFTGLFQVANGQQTTGPSGAFFHPQAPTRDARAVQIIETAINNMGASNSVNAIQDCVLVGTSDSDSKTEGHKTFTWTIAGDEFRFDVSSADRSGYFVSGHGSPTNSDNGKISTLKSYVARANLPYYLPGFLLSKELANPNYSIQYIGTKVINGRQAIQVHLSDGSDQITTWVSPQDWYFDPASTIPFRVEFRIPPNESLVKWIKGTYDFSDYRIVNSLLTPYQISFAMEHLPSRIINFSSVTFNAGVSPSTFDAPKEIGQ